MYQTRKKKERIYIINFEKEVNNGFRQKQRQHQHQANKEIGLVLFSACLGHGKTKEAHQGRKNISEQMEW